MTQIFEHYRALAAEFTRRVEAVRAGQWDNPSPCAGWSARDVLRHVIDLHRDMPGYVGLSVGLRRSTADDPLGAWVEARDGMQALLEDPARAGLEYDGFFGRTSLERTVDRFLGFDLLIHGWDIARATGQDKTLPADEVHRVYAESADAMRAREVPGLNEIFGPVVSVPDDAPEQDRLLGLLGRTP